MKLRIINLILLVAGLVNGNAVTAQNTESVENRNVKGWLHAVVYKKDGTTAEGYLHNIIEVGTGLGVTRSIHMPSADASEMILKASNKMLENSTKIKNCEIDSMVTWLDESPERRDKWEPEIANFAYGGKNPDIEEFPSMLLVLYNGKNVKGYMAHRLMYGFKCFFKMDDMPYAKAFLSAEEKFSERRRKTLLDTFYMYPEMEDYIKQLKKEDVVKDPFCIIKKLDEILSNYNSGQPSDVQVILR